MSADSENAVTDLVARLREQGIDVIRVVYSDLIGVDRGRDVLVEEFADTVARRRLLPRGLPHNARRATSSRCRAASTPACPTSRSSPTSTRSHPCRGSRARAGASATPSTPAAARRGVARGWCCAASRPGSGSSACAPWSARSSSSSSWSRRRRRRLAALRRRTGNVYVAGRKGDPEGVLLTMLRQLRDVGLRVTAANHEFSGGQFEINLAHSELLDAADRAFRLKSAVQEIARHDDSGHLHGQAVQRRGRLRVPPRTCRWSTRPARTCSTTRRRRTGCRRRAGPRSPACSPTPRRWRP